MRERTRTEPGLMVTSRQAEQIELLEAQLADQQRALGEATSRLASWGATASGLDHQVVEVPGPERIVRVEIPGPDRLVEVIKEVKVGDSVHAVTVDALQLELVEQQTYLTKRAEDAEAEVKRLLQICRDQDRDEHERAALAGSDVMTQPCQHLIADTLVSDAGTRSPAVQPAAASNLRSFEQLLLFEGRQADQALAARRVSGIESLEHLKATLAAQLGKSSEGLTLLYYDAEFRRFALLEELDQLPSMHGRLQLVFGLTYRDASLVASDDDAESLAHLRHLTRVLAEMIEICAADEEALSELGVHVDGKGTVMQ